MKKNKEMVKAPRKFIKEGKELSPPKPIISKPPLPASLNPLIPDLMPLLPLGEIEVNYDALTLVMERNYKEKENVHEPMTIEELFDATSVVEPNYVEDLMYVPNCSSHHMVIEDEEVVMEDQVC